MRLKIIMVQHFQIHYRRKLLKYRTAINKRIVSEMHKMKAIYPILFEVHIYMKMVRVILGLVQGPGTSPLRSLLQLEAMMFMGI